MEYAQKLTSTELNIFNEGRPSIIHVYFVFGFIYVNSVLILLYLCFLVFFIPFHFLYPLVLAFIPHFSKSFYFILFYFISFHFILFYFIFCCLSSHAHTHKHFHTLKPTQTLPPTSINLTPTPISQAYKRLLILTGINQPEIVNYKNQVYLEKEIKGTLQNNRKSMKN